MQKIKALGIIPARYESTRFPGKPLVEILGKSLVRRTYENALLCKDLEKVVVATDDIRILDHVIAFGGEAVMTSLDCHSGTDRLYEVIEKYPVYKDFDIIVNVQGDEPCLNPEIISLLIEKLKSDPDAVVSTPIAPLTSLEDALNPSTVKCVKDLQDNALYFSRSLIPGHKGQGFKEGVNYFRHVGLYAYRSEFLKIYAHLPKTALQLAEDLEQLKVLEHGYRIKVALVDSPPIDVNHPEDIQKIEKYLCRQNLSL